MPTLRPRYTVTETEELARALDAAALVWPEQSGDRGALLRRLIEQGAERVDAAAEAQRAARRAVLRELSGSLTGASATVTRRGLLEEWPE